MFMSSIIISAVFLTGLISSFSLISAAIATASTFLCGTILMVGTKKTLGKESDHINRDITE